MLKKLFTVLILLCAFNVSCMEEKFKEDIQINDKKEPCKYYPKIYLALQEDNFKDLLSAITEIHSKLKECDYADIDLATILFTIMFKEIIPMDQIEQEMQKPYLLTVYEDEIADAFASAFNAKQLIKAYNNPQNTVTAEINKKRQDLAGFVESMLDELIAILHFKAINDFYKSNLLSKESILNSFKTKQIQELEKFVHIAQANRIGSMTITSTSKELSKNVFKNENIDFEWQIKLIERENPANKEVIDSLIEIIKNLKKISIFISNLGNS